MVQASQPDSDSSTPIPWKAEHEESSGNDKLWGDTDCVGIIYQQGLPDSANAKLIVRAVNNHDKLLAALEAVQRDFGQRELTAETVTRVHTAIEEAQS